MIRKDNGVLLQDVGDTSLLVPMNARVMDLSGIITLNATGRFLWEQLAEERSAEDLAASLTKRFDVGAQQAQVDVRAFVDQIAEFGLLQA